MYPNKKIDESTPGDYRERDVFVSCFEDVKLMVSSLRFEVGSSQRRMVSGKNVPLK